MESKIVFSFQAIALTLQFIKEGTHRVTSES